MFYSLNTFCLPRDPLKHILACYNRFQPQHRAMIKEMAMTWCLLDLTTAILEQVSR